jgi:hypothetical protein
LDTVKGFGGLLVSKTDLGRVMPEVSSRYFEANGYPLHRLTKVLFPERPMKERVLRKWIQLGLLSAKRVGRAQVVTAEEVEHFRSLYCLAAEACQILEIARKSLARWETEGRIRPVYGPRVTPRAGISLYLRADLDRLKSERAGGRFRRSA